MPESPAYLDPPEPGCGHLPLAELPRGACAVVHAVEADDATDADRLKAMGVCPGQRVHLIKPGDPLILHVLGARLGLSARLAAGVRVTPCTPETAAARPGRWSRDR